MSIAFGWPEYLYLALNIGCLALMFSIPSERREPANPGCALVIWLFVTIPLLIWGGFF